MAVENSIDNLVIKINTTADNATKGLESLITSLEKLNGLTESLTKVNSNLKGLATSLQEVSTASKGLKLSGTAKEIEKVSDAVENSGNKSKKTAKLWGSTTKLLNFGSLVYAGKKIASVFSSSIQAANDYIESQNLFAVAMGDFADEATEWSNEVSTALGIDPAEIQKNMGYFQQLSTALGVTSDKAYVLTKNMTSLAYDISSLYNINIDQSFLKLQSALVGELEPIRRLGIDISKARLQQELYDLGVRANVESLSQADKAMLRYLAIMKQTTNAQADMGKTLMSPANALRVLKSSFIQLARSIGYVFIPILQALLPVIQLVTKALALLAEKLAVFLGFEMPKFDTEGIKNTGGEIDSMGDSIDDTSKKLKSFTTGFDELNVISDNASGGLGDVGGSILGDIELPEYDILSKYAGNLANEALPKLTEAFERFGNSPGVQLALEVLKKLWDTIKGFAEWALENPEEFGNWLVGIATALGAIAAVKGIADIATAVHGVWVGLGYVGTGLGKVFDWIKKILGKNPGEKLRKIGGIIVIVGSAILLIKEILKIVRGEVEDFGKVFKTILLAIGGLVVGVALVIGSAFVGAIGGILIVVATFWEELKYGLGTLGKWILNAFGTFAVTLASGIFGFIAIVDYVIDMIWITIKHFFETLWYGFQKVILQIGKFIKQKIADFLDSDMMQGFIGFLDNLFGTNFQASIELITDTSDIDKKIAELDKKLEPTLLDKWGDRTDQLKTDFANAGKEARGILSGLYEYTDSAQDNLGKELDAKWAKQKEQDTLWGKFSVGFDFGAGAEDQLKKLEESANIMNTQLETQQNQLQETKLSNELASLQQQLDTESLEKETESADTLKETATTLSDTAKQNKMYQSATKLTLADIGTKISNLWWKLDKVQRACENIRINIIHNHYYGGGGGGVEEYALGGLPNRGDVFVANEAGPEWVGSLGTQTAVANSDQMVAAFAQGVYQGMMSATRDSSSSRKIEIPVSVLLPNNRVLATATAEGQIANGYDIGLGGFDV